MNEKEIRRRDELSENIKSVHSQLRIRFQDHSVDPNAEWSKHASSRKGNQSSNGRDDYSSWMKELGTQHWNQDHRKDWIRDKVNRYFLNDDRRKVFDKLRQKSGKNLAEDDEIYFEKKWDEKIKVLDVGSCYNPFKDLDENWDVLGIDLHGSLEDQVFQCDFLNVPISPFLGLNDATVEYLPEDYFDVVLFCLFLEYLPLPIMRYNAIRQAKVVLKPGGLLLFVSPDSSHQGKNARQMKAWRSCLEDLGFVRVYYEKLTHVHCSAFANVVDNLGQDYLRHRSVSLRQQLNVEQIPVHELMYIPQDKTTQKMLLVSNKKEDDEEEGNQETIYSFEDFPDFD